MELVLALAIGVLTASGIWLLLRPRTFQVIMGLTLLSYAVNLFIFAMGRLTVGVPPLVEPGIANNPGVFVPRYSMVMFRDDIPYAVAYERGRIQNEILSALTQQVDTLAAIDYDAATRMIEKKLAPLPG